MDFISDQLPIPANGVKLVEDTFDQEAEQVLANMRIILRACSSDIDHLMQIRAYIDKTNRGPSDC